MKTHVEFRSNKFPPHEGEEEEVNPGLWGKRLGWDIVSLDKNLDVQLIRPHSWYNFCWSLCLFSLIEKPENHANDKRKNLAAVVPKGV